MTKLLRILAGISRIALSIVFIFSGFVKAIDPLGSAYKFHDYFDAFHIEFLEPIALPLAIILSSLEFIIGFALFMGVRMKIASRLVTLFMVIFTLLTLYIAIKNPVTDCGCFGDALILTNWQTFKKNLVLMLFVALVYIYRDRFTQLYATITEWIIVIAGIVFIVILSIHCTRHLPIMDFRPYNIGTYIPEKMIVPEDAPADIYKTYLYYEKDNVVKEFTEENYPWDDTTWKFVDSKSILVKKGYEPPIHDFNITSPGGEDITDLVLQDQDYSFLLISYEIEKANREVFLLFKMLKDSLQQENFSFYCLTSSPSEEMESIRKEYNVNYNCYATDEITLKTIIRSNPGLVLLKEGMIIGKWHYNDWPLWENFKENTISKQITRFKKEYGYLHVITIILYFIIFFSLFLLLRQYFISHR